MLCCWVVAMGCGDGPIGNAEGVDATPACLPSPPAGGTDCAAFGAGTRCTYDRCGDLGLVQASCDQGTWSVTSTACSELSCQGQPCADGSICVAQVGGALLIDCRPHTCGNGPLASDCVCGDDRGEASAPYGDGTVFTCYLDCGLEICP